MSYVIFEPDTYSFNVDRNYDQQRLVYIHNIDNESHTIEVGVINSYTDLIVGFIGDAAPGNFITLGPGESRALILNIHAQDALYEDYDIAATITTSGVSHSLDYANIHIDVRQPDINLIVTYISQNPYTLAKKYRITNYGDPITDLHVYLATETLQGKVFIQPQINHGNIGTNESIDITLTPIITEAGWTGANGYFYVDGLESYMGSKIHVETYVEWTLPPGYAVYLITLIDPKLFFDLHDWYCVNAPTFYSGFYLPWGFGQEDIKTATLRFVHTGLNPVDEMKIYLNNNQLTSGYRRNSLVTFQIPPEYFNYPTQEQGTAWNDIKGTIKTPLGFYKIARDIRVVIHVGTLTMYMVGTSSQAAYNAAWTLSYIHKNADTLMVNIINPQEGFTRKIGEKTLVKVEVTDDKNIPQWLCDVIAYFSNGDAEIYLYDDGLHDDGNLDDGIYANWWIPVNPGSVTITVAAKNCKTQATDTVSGTIITNHPPTVQITHPLQEQVLKGTISIKWQGNDLDGDSLSYKVYYGPSESGPWTNKIYDGVDTSCTWDTTTVENATWFIHVIVSDGGLTGSDTVKVKVKNPKPEIKLSPTSGSKGAIVTVYGKEFGSFETVQIDFGNHLNITTGFTDEKGSFTATFTVDAQPVGIVTVTATGLTSNAKVYTTFTITSLHYLKGYVRYAKNGEGAPGVKVYLISPNMPKTYITSSDGYYEFTGLPDGYYRLSPYKEWYTFEPSGRKYEHLDASYDNQDFTATPHRYYLKGRCKTETNEGVGGVQVILSGPVYATYTTNAGGDYGFWDLPEGTYTITPNRQFWTFEPQNITCYLDFHKINQDFVGTSTTEERYYIKGTITDEIGAGLAGVRVYLISPTMPLVYTTHANGYYEFTNLTPGYYRTSPYKPGYTFKPSGREYEFLCANYDNQNFDDDGPPPEGSQTTPPAEGISSVFIVVKNDKDEAMEGVKLDAIPIIEDKGLNPKSKIQNPKSPIPTTTTITDQDGMADILYLEGTYEIQASKEGYKSQSKIITILGENNVIDLEFALEPIPLPLPTANKLYQNYPNPFNPKQEETYIPYDLTQGAQVVIKIYNIAGELVRTLEENRNTAGSYEAIWNGRNDDNDIVSNGVYFYQLHVGGGVVGTKKILVVK